MANNNTTIPTTPAILRALAEGVDRLNDGDEQDCARAREVEDLVFERLGLVRAAYHWEPKEARTSGYTRANGYVWVNAEGEWSAERGAVEPGTELFLTRQCKRLLRIIP